LVPVRRSDSARLLEEAPTGCGERLRIEAVERVVAIGRADALPHRIERRPRGRRRGSPGAQPALLLDPCADASHEDREFLDVLRAVRETLPGAVARGTVRAAREGGERNAAHAARQQQFESVD